MPKRNAGDVKRVDLELGFVILKDGEYVPITHRFGIHDDEVEDPEHVVKVVAGPTQSDQWIATLVELDERF